RIVEAIGEIERAVALAIGVSMPPVALERLESGRDFARRDRQHLNAGGLEELLHTRFGLGHGNALLAEQPDRGLPYSKNGCDRPFRARRIELRRKTLRPELAGHYGDDHRRVDEHQ